MGLEEKRRNLVKCINMLIKYLKELHKTQKNVDSKNGLAREFFKDFCQRDFNAIIQKLETNLQIIERPNFKCVFVGKTSNGKSSVINALLGEDVLPSGQGTTTCCIISIKGCNDHHGCVMVDEEKKPVDYLRNVNQFTLETKVELFYPKIKCPLLGYDVELIDSPAIGVKINNDDYIEEHSKDADLFICVVNCTSGLSDSEKQFFKRILEKVGQTNVIVLINKWDTIIDTFKEEFTKVIMEQFNEKIKPRIDESVNIFNKYVEETSDLMKQLKTEKENCDKILTEINKISNL